MDRLQCVIAVSDIIIGRYGKDPERAKKLKYLYGSKAAAEIQEEVNICLRNNKEATYIAVACIADHYGKGSERRKKLGRWYDKAQKRIEMIYSMRGKSLERVAKDVINGNYDKLEVRKLLLKFCGYDPDAVQKKVDDILNPKPIETGPKFRIHAEHFFRKDKSEFGSCTAIYQYTADGKTIDKCVLIDTAKNTAADVVIEDLKAQGVKQIDTVVISHAHGDHYGALKKITKAFPVKWVYLPDTTELDKYQKGYGNALRRQAAKAPNHRFLKAGESFVIGEIKGKNLFICPAEKLKKHDHHYFVNDESMYLQFDLGKAVFATAGDMTNAAANVMIKTVGMPRAHVRHCSFHGDGNATNDEQVKQISGTGKQKTLWHSDYHDLEKQGGRQITRERIEKYNGTIYRNAEDGQIYFDIEGDKITVTTTKSKKKDVYTI